MPLYQVTVIQDGRIVSAETLRATTAEQGRAQLQLRLARCLPGEPLVLTLGGVEQGRLGPKRS